MHKSVLLQETIDNLNVRENLIYVDATLGYAGHSREVLKRINKGFLFAFDQDSEAIEYSNEILKSISQQYEIIHSNFVNLKSELLKRGITTIDGIMFDLGVPEYLLRRSSVLMHRQL
jgi:16S rRNA (cytosine1402-N4)-methyltransferase